MSWTKQQLIEQAYGQLALASYVYDLTPDEMLAALRNMDAMLASWNLLGLRLGYPLPSSPGEDGLADDSSLPDGAVLPVYMNLAVLTAASKGKLLTQDQRNIAKQSYDALVMRAAMPPEMQTRSNMPAGAGNKPWRSPASPFLPSPTDPIVAVDGDATITFD